MSTLFPAHIRIEDWNGIDRESTQSCQAHCRTTARYAAEALSPVGLEKAGYLCGLLHDAGKFTDAFREYLIQAVHGGPVRRGSVNHTFAGVRLLLTRYHHPEAAAEMKDIVCELLAYAVGAHHGLFDCVDEQRKSGFRYRLEKADIAYTEAAQNFLAQCADTAELDSLFSAAVEEVTPLLERLCNLASQDERGDSEVAFYIGLTARLLLSAVIEGDRRDTAEFMNGFSYPAFPKDRSALWERCLDRMEQKLAAFPSDTAIQAARQAISRQCRAFAEQPGGVYRLNVPTGGGKTLSSLRYALAHAARWNKSRILFVIPLLAIIEQNAKVIRDYIQDDSLILEHHSNVVRTETQQDELDLSELLAENWGSLIMITTLVQLLNTLFSGKTTAIRRFQALCNSVIVIDEVQTVPTRMLTQFNLAVNFLSEVCGATVILCSATQPCLEAACHPLAHEPIDLVPHDPALWSVFQRTVIQDAGRYRLEDIPSFARTVLQETNSLLIVCNKKDEAELLYRHLSNGEGRCFHLSAAMCMAHRRKTLQEIGQSLERGKLTGEKTVCVSTQVIEAGVDISFGRTIRLLAGMDSVVQSAGRCNRNGEDPDPAPVYLVQCTDEQLRMLPDIKRAQDAAIDLLEEYRQRPEDFHHDLSSDAAVRYYYRRLYREMPEGFQDYAIPGKPTLYSLLSENDCYADGDFPDYERFYLRQAFKLAGSLFQVFDSDTTDVLVPYGDGGEIIDNLCSERAKWDKAYVKEQLEQAKPYTVSLFQYQKQKLEEQGALSTICDGSILTLQPGYYDEYTGLSLTEHSAGYLEVF